MTARLRYRPVDDKEAGKQSPGNRVISRLRLIKLFGKKEKLYNFHEKSTKDETHSISNTTADLSPVKEDENDSYADEFDTYFSHVPITKSDELDLLVKKSSVHYQAGKTKATPPPPQKKWVLTQSALNASPSSTIDTDTVDNSLSNLNSIIKTISSLSQQAERIPSVFGSDNNKGDFEKNTEESSTKTKAPKSMDDVKRYLTQLKAGALTAPEDPDSCKESSQYDIVDVKKYQQLFRTKLNSIVQSISAATPDVRQPSSAMDSSCENHMCSILECTSDLLNPALDPSPLGKSWLTMNEDSDTVSKLTMPFHSSELTMSTTSSADMSDFIL